jgi:tetratricopeptide (TPR) repeat protein
MHRSRFAHVNAAWDVAVPPKTSRARQVRGAPNNPAARFALARALFVQNQFDEAERTLTPRAQRRAEFSRNPVAARADRRAPFRFGDGASLVHPRTGAGSSLRGPPCAVWSKMDIVDVNRRRGARRAEAALAKAPKDPGVLLVAGRAYAAAVDLARSEAVLQQAIKEDASMLEAYHVLGQILVRQKRLDDARAAYENRVTERPDDVAAHTMIGMILLAQGRVPQARRHSNRRWRSMHVLP